MTTTFKFTNDYLNYFRRKYGKDALLLASHAAFPLALTPELLHLLRENFVPESPYIAVTDVLLSLSEQVGFRLYKMLPDIRPELLQFLKQEKGEQRLKDLADFMIEYISANLPSDKYLAENLGATPQWTALSLIQPEKVTKALAEKLRLALQGRKITEWLYFAPLAESYEEFFRDNQDFQSLLHLARGNDFWARGYNDDAKAEFNQVGKENTTLQIAGFDFTIPVVMDLHIFNFETVTVNRKGKIIHTETKSARYLTEDLGDGIILEMVEIPGGTFLMGAPQGEGDDDERPQHEVTLRPFFMAKYPITQAQWRAVAKMPRVTRKLKANPSGFKGDQRPVEQVSWLDAVEFCARLSKHTGKDYSLPSESQWEYACLANTTTPFHFGPTITTKLVNYGGKYPYGDAPIGEFRKETTNVGIFPPNGFGLYDMHGNVWEWCADEWHKNYEGAPTDGSAWIEDDNLSQRHQSGNNLVDEKINKNDNKKDVDEKLNDKIRLLRGGSWNSLARICRSADRSNYSMGNRTYKIGFRVVVRQ